MRTLQLPVYLDILSPTPVTVQYSTRDGTAVADRDYVAFSGSVLWAPGEYRKYIPLQILDGAVEGDFFVDLYAPMGAGLGDDMGIVSLRYSIPGTLNKVKIMMDALWEFVKRSTGSSIAVDGMPPLVTTEGMVKNNQFTGTALGGYTPDGTASTEGVALMLRGAARAYAADGDPEKLNYCYFLMEAAVKYFYGNIRPSENPDTPWLSNWLVNAGPAFNVRGPIDPEGILARNGYVGGYSPESVVHFSDGRAVLPIAPEVIYQVVTGSTEFVWHNVYSDIVAGTGSEIKVAYYFDSKGNKVYGTQKRGSNGQPIDPPGSPGNPVPEAPGTIVLEDTSFTGTTLVNFCVEVPEVQVLYGENYEAWPMWRRLLPSEFNNAGDAIHWFADCFRILKNVDPTHAEWTLALERVLDTWELVCDYQVEFEYIFKKIPGAYNNFPLTHGFAFGRSNVNDPATSWSAIPPTDKFTVARDEDNYVVFDMPEMYDEPVSPADPNAPGGQIRYGYVFENSPLYMSFTGESELIVDIHADKQLIASLEMTDDQGKTRVANFITPTVPVFTSTALSQFFEFQTEPGDATGDKTGDWEAEWEPPVYEAVPFPGRKVGLVGDSITWYNNQYFPPDETDHLAYQAFGMCGYWNFANSLSGNRLTMEPELEPGVSPHRVGLNFAIAGTRVANWWKEVDYPLGEPEVGPMYAALQHLNKYNIVIMMGGTNDLAGNASDAEVLLNIRKAAYDLASRGKWVFLLTIPPRSRGLLTGYTLSQQNVIRTRLMNVNAGLRTWYTQANPPNIFLVDPWADLVGPNGIDPAGTLSHPSNPDGGDSRGNFRSDAPDTVFFHDGLHPGPAAAYVMGKKLAEAFIAAGIPANPNETTVGTLTLGPNLIPNPNFTFTQYDMPAVGSAQTFNYSRIGWATGLGTHRQIAGSPPKANGYPYGNVPDHWQFWRASNAENEVVGLSPSAGTFSNFVRYTFTSLADRFPALAEYFDDSSWGPGAVQLSLTTDDGVPALRIDLNIPQTGQKQEGFVLNTHIPQDQHGAWDNYGFQSPDVGPVTPNTVYTTGDLLRGSVELRFQGFNATVHSNRVLMNFLGVDPNDTEYITSYAKISAIAQGHNFWPPDDLDKVRLHPENKTLTLNTPVMAVPSYTSNETRRYMQFRLEFSCDASQGPVVGTIFVRRPAVRKIIGV